MARAAAMARLAAIWFSEVGIRLDYAWGDLSWSVKLLKTLRKLVVTGKTLTTDTADSAQICADLERVIARKSVFLFCSVLF